MDQHWPAKSSWCGIVQTPGLQNEQLHVFFDLRPFAWFCARLRPICARFAGKIARFFSKASLQCQIRNPCHLGPCVRIQEIFSKRVPMQHLRIPRVLYRPGTKQTLLYSTLGEPGHCFKHFRIKFIHCCLPPARDHEVAP